jgi:tetratricopeptide (TPR) repeat protein
MKKTICIFALLLFVFSGFGQIVDSAVVREVDSLMQLAGQLTEKRAFGQAFEIMVKAETSALESSGKLSALYGNVCFQYGKTHLAKGDYQEAEKRLVQAKTILEKELGPQHVEYAAVLHQLGTVYYFMGNNYEKAELNNLEARKIQEKTPGRESQAYIETTFLLGHIYLYTGNYNQAENHYLETSALQEKLRGKENAFYASILRCMGFVYAKQGKFETAKQYFQANVDIVEKVLGKNSIPYAAGIMSLSWPCMELGELLRAESLLLESKVIFESMANYTEIPSYMSCMEYFGILYNKRGRYDEAEFYHLRSKALRETKLGKDHLSVELSLSYLSDLYWKTGRTEQAAKCFTEGSEMRRKHLANAVRHFSEKELFSFVALFEQALHKHLSFACDFSTKVPPFQGNCFDNVLFYKGFLLNAACQFRNAVHVDTAFAEKFETWKNVRYQLAAAYSQPSSLRENTRITNLETQVNALEKYLANTIVDLNEALGQFGWQEVQAALRPDEAALEFVHFNYYSPGPTDSVMYAALLLRPGMEHPLFIPLFEEKSLAAMLPPFEKNRSEYINKLYEDDAPAKLIWSPLDPHLHGVKTIYSAYSGYSIDSIW